MKTTPTYFITGNSRSGTTMMMRILDNHPEVHAINEPHFFEKRWSPSDSGHFISREEAIDLLVALFTGQRDGFFAPPAPGKYTQEASELLDSLPGTEMTRLDVYREFLHYETRIEGKRTPCEKTPQNVFYIKEILENFPEARIVNMVRDPRSVMLSQKRKWKRKSLGADFLTGRELMRLRVNYHPITISKLWNASIGAVSGHADHPHILNVKFEQLLADPEGEVRRICNFLGIPFDPDMLNVPLAGSSTEPDRKSQTGIRQGRANSWQQGGLSGTELYICQQTCQKGMQNHGYSPVRVQPNPVWLGLSYLVFPVKIGAALLMNLDRMRNLGDTLKRRLKP